MKKAFLLVILFSVLGVELVNAGDDRSEQVKQSRDYYTCSNERAGTCLVLAAMMLASNHALHFFNEDDFDPALLDFTHVASSGLATTFALGALGNYIGASLEPANLSPEDPMLEIF